MTRRTRPRAPGTSRRRPVRDGDQPDGTDGDKDHIDGTACGDGTYLVSLLGGFGLCRGGEPVVLTAREQRLTALLALHGAQTRPLLAGMLWPETDEHRARQNLRAAVATLSRQAPGLVVATHLDVVLDPRTRVDVRAFVAVAQGLLREAATADDGSREDVGRDDGAPDGRRADGGRPDDGTAGRVRARIRAVRPGAASTDAARRPPGLAHDVGLDDDPGDDPDDTRDGPHDDPHADDDGGLDEVLTWRRSRGGLPLLGTVFAGGGRLGGELLPGWYDDWVLVEAERLQHLRLHALEALARLLSAAGHHGLALEVALSAVALDPLRESAQRAVIEVHAREGNVATALAQYERLRRRLARELHIEPSPQMAALVARLQPPPEQPAGDRATHAPPARIPGRPAWSPQHATVRRRATR